MVKTTDQDLRRDLKKAERLLLVMTLWSEHRLSTQEANTRLSPGNREDRRRQFMNSSHQLDYSRKGSFCHLCPRMKGCGLSSDWLLHTSCVFAYRGIYSLRKREFNGKANRNQETIWFALFILQMSKLRPVRPNGWSQFTQPVSGLEENPGVLLPLILTASSSLQNHPQVE